MSTALAALAGVTPATVLAVPPDCSAAPLSTASTITQPWATGNCTITSTGSVIVTTQDAALNATGTVAGTLTNNGTLNSALYGVNNAGYTGALINAGTISGTAVGAFGVLNAAGSTLFTLNNLAGGAISGVGAGIANNGVIENLTNLAGATISSAQFGVFNNNNSAAISSLLNNGVIIGTVAGVSNSAGRVNNLNNVGTINSDGTGVYNAATISFLTNSGRIAATGSGSSTGIANTGTIGNLNNAGTIVSTGVGVSNSGATITNLSNMGAISSAGAGIYNNASNIDSLINLGVISSSNDYGISNSSGTIALLVNIGAVSGGGLAAINNGGAINSLSNGGIISAANAGILNTGSIPLLINSGNIVSTGASAISNAGSIGLLINGANSTITGARYALNNASSGMIGNILNTGVIAGDIINASTRDLTIIGFGNALNQPNPPSGVLTGFGGATDAGHIGLISNTLSNVVFGAGNLLLNDNINVAGHSVINSGATLQVNNAITITGNYTQNAAAKLNIGVGAGAVASGVVSADKNYGRLVVSGNATFDASSAVSLQKTGTVAFAPGQRYVVVQASNAGANYNAGLLKYSAADYTGPVTGASVVDTDNGANTDLVVTLGAREPANNASDPNVAAALSGLFRYTGTNAGMLGLFNAAAAVGGTAAVDNVAAQLNPGAISAALVQAAGAASQAVANIAAAHVDAMRVAQASGGGVAAGDSPRDVAMWGQAFGGQAKQSDRAEGAGYTAGYNGLLIGADTAINDLWRAGALASYANTSIASSGNNGGNSGHVNAYGVTAYASYTADAWYLNLSGGIARQKYDTLRAVNFTGFSGAASGSFNGTQYITSAQAGFPVRLDAVTTLTPIAGLTYSRLNQDDYTETGSAVALHMNSSSMSSVKSDLGARLDRTYKTSFGDMSPSAQLGWRHEYLSTRLQSVGNFAADTTGSTSFTTQGPGAERDTAVLVLGATLARSQNLTLAAHYTVEAASGFTAQTADLRLRYQF